VFFWTGFCGFGGFPLCHRLLEVICFAEKHEKPPQRLNTKDDHADFDVF